MTVNNPYVSIDKNTLDITDGIGIGGRVVLPADFPGLGSEEFDISLKAGFDGRLSEANASLSVTGPKQFIDDTYLENLLLSAKLNDNKDGMLLELNGKIRFGNDFPQGLSGAVTSINCVVDTTGGLEEITSKLELETLNIMDSFDVEDAVIEFEMFGTDDIKITLGGDIILPDSFPEGLPEKVSIKKFSFTPSGTIEDLEIKMSCPVDEQWDLWGGAALKNGAFEVTNNGNDELIFSFTGGVLLPTSMQSTFGSDPIEITELKISNEKRFGIFQCEV